MSLQHRHGLQLLPRCCNTNTAACKHHRLFQNGGTQPCHVTTAPVQPVTTPVLGSPGNTAHSPAMSLQHWRNLQAPPPCYNTNTVARKPHRLTTTPTRRHTAPSCRYDTSATCKRRRLATTPTWQPQHCNATAPTWHCDATTPTQCRDAHDTNVALRQGQQGVQTSERHTREAFVAYKYSSTTMLY
ncbi:hypothetical protein EDB84DRAFT_1439169 [Lactarius hengduanensis]|nr:hypothetical protein EDB84DRAFT_1439169 [Lactarius hengduanensis]